MSNMRLFLIILLFNFFLYFDLIFTAAPANPDGRVIFALMQTYGSFNEYWNDLISFNFYDFQPVRDLYYYIAMKLTTILGHSPMVSMNVILWSLCSTVLINGINRYFSTQPLILKVIYSLILLTMPIIVHSVSWGIASKHLLAVTFIILATTRVLKDNIDRKESIFISFFYGLSVFSQPITILWPLWVIMYRGLKDRALNISLFLILFIAAFINYKYYTTSELMLSIYGRKTSDLFDIPDKFLSVGHYFFQMVFPFKLSFKYSLGDVSVIIGLVLFIFFLFYIYKRKELWRINTLSLFFGVLPLIVVLANAQAVYDTYLIIPVIIFYFIIFSNLPVGTKFFRMRIVVLSLIFLSFLIYDYKLIRNWKSDNKLSAMSFKNRQNCFNAYAYLHSFYQKDLIPEKNVEAVNFLHRNECDKFELNLTQNAYMHMYIAFYEEDIPYDERVKILTRLSEVGLMQKLSLAAFYIKYDQTSHAQKVISEIMRIPRPHVLDDLPINFVNKYILPFCNKDNDEKCIKYFSNESSKSLLRFFP